MAAASAPCDLCGVFQPDGWTVETALDEPSWDDFPAAFGQLDLVRRVEGSWQAQAWYRCPVCGQVYEYSRTTPGGSVDAQRTWIVQRLRPVAGLPPESPPTANTLGADRCRQCGARSVGRSVGFIGGEAFVTLTCSVCGFEETLDEYELGER